MGLASMHERGMVWAAPGAGMVSAEKFVVVVVLDLGGTQ